LTVVITRGRFYLVFFHNLCFSSLSPRCLAAGVLSFLLRCYTERDFLLTQFFGNCGSFIFYLLPQCHHHGSLLFCLTT
jgi:hypothetical protein